MKEEIKRADKVVKPFNVRKIKKSAFEFFPHREKTLFKTGASVNSRDEASCLRNNLLKSQTHWMVDESYH